MKPDWKDAPEWAAHLAMEADGKWWWFENQPTVSADFDEWKHAGQEMPASDETPKQWHETLESRP